MINKRGHKQLPDRPKAHADSDRQRGSQKGRQTNRQTDRQQLAGEGEVVHLGQLVMVQRLGTLS